MNKTFDETFERSFFDISHLEPLYKNIQEYIKKDKSYQASIPNFSKIFHQICKSTYEQSPELVKAQNVSKLDETIAISILKFIKKYKEDHANNVNYISPKKEKVNNVLNNIYKTPGFDEITDTDSVRSVVVPIVEKEKERPVSYLKTKMYVIVSEKTIINLNMESVARIDIKNIIIEENKIRWLVLSSNDVNKIYDNEMNASAITIFNSENLEKALISIDIEDKQVSSLELTLTDLFTKENVKACLFLDIYQKN